MVRSLVLNPYLLPTIFLLCISSYVDSIHLGNETDRLALLAFKEKITDDPLQVMSSWNESTHFCAWEGITCSRRHQRVEVLDLTSQRLVGFVSPYIGNLSRLLILSLNNNNFQGNIPLEISHLSRLQALSLPNNSFVGRIPTNLVQCSNLRYLFLEVNKLVGKIPSEFGSFTNLVKLWVGKNNLIGSIPVALGNVSTLESLYLGENYLEGNIPNSLGKLKNLRILALGVGKLSGMVPPSIYNLSALQVLAVVSNELQGSLPLSIGRDFPLLEEFYMADNQFSGTLPVSLFTNTSQLSHFDVSHNTFGGQLPIEVGNLKKIKTLRFGQNHFGTQGKNNDLGFVTSLSNCTNLEFLSIAYNNFGGSLPSSLTKLSAMLTQLYLKNNQIFGNIPSDIWKLKNLIKLDASFNFLTGTIPKEIGLLRKLQVLDLGNNRLTGKIPNAIQNLTSLYVFYLSDNMLEGNVEPSLEKCLKLQNLFIGNNILTGNIPKHILSLDLLSVDLSNNFLIGSLPQEVAQLKNLVFLDLSKNKLSGDIPTTLGSCFNLEELYLNGNSFQGTIPYSFRGLVVIKIIDLSRNSLSGKIPKTIENLSNLRHFNISFNNIEGEVPSKGIFQNVSRFFFDENEKLCGGPDKLKLHKCLIPNLKKKGFSMKLKLTIGVLVSLSIIGTILALLALYLRNKSNAKSISKEYANELQRISYDVIRKATSEFSSSNLIGIGSFASVYKGVLRESGFVIAVKVFNLMERGASKSFIGECEILRKIRHRNLLKILTVCSSIDFDGNDFKALILEFMPYGSLEDWLHPSSEISQRSSRTLSLLQMLNIAIDIASALDYLHNCYDTPIIHCDLKPSNVLLNKDLVAYVSDFGLAKFLSQSQSDLNKSESNSNAVRGTIGYIPPEYGMSFVVSTRGDIYSYGVMLFEMITGRRPTDKMFNDNLSLHDFCNAKLGERDVEMVNIILLMDQSQNVVREEMSMTHSMKMCLLSTIEIGVACSSEVASDRMDIKDVLTKIHKIKEAFVNIINHGGKTDIESNI